MSFNDKKSTEKDLLESTRKFTPSKSSGTQPKEVLSDREKKKKSIKNKKRRRNIVYGIFRFIGAILKLIIILAIIALLTVAGLGVGLYLSIINGAGALSKEDLEINNFTTYVYDINGNEYTTLSGAENRTYASLDEISPYLPKAFISIEDERFYQHKGVDIKRTAGATFKYILSKFGMGSSEFGGSTITQQVIKKVTGEDDRSSLRKAKEIIRAFQLEKWLSKDEIIELYMNLIYLGEGSYGVEAASYTYFGKSAKDLDIAECAVIAGLAQAPEGYNPYKHPDRAKSRQELVLGKMLELEVITQEQYDAAKAEELVYTRGELNLASSNSYFVDAVVESVIKDLMKAKNVNRQMAQKMVYNNGLKIYTTLDPAVQNILEETYLNKDYFQTRKGYDEDLQSAMVIIDYKEGNVIGLVGGAGEKTTLRGLNRATGMTRSIGSNMKPLGVYGPGLEAGVLTAATTFDDVPTTYKIGGRAWTIKNYDGKYRGMINIRKAIEISDNIVAAKAIQEKVGTEYSYNFLQKLGISSLTSADRQSPASLSLGGMSKGISPLEVAAAYGTIANKGVYVEPRLYTRIEDRNGQLFYTKTQEIRDVMSVENAYILTDMMHTVTTGSEGTGRNARLSGGIEVAAKTGTTSDDKDRWFSAFTPYYVGSVWFGYDTPTYINVASNPGTKVWHDVMEQVHKVKGCQAANFEKPAGVVEVAVCRDSGLIATDACKADQRGSRVITEIFNSKNGTIPKQKCNLHEMVTVCPDTNLLPTDECRKQTFMYEVSRINRHYQNGQPTIKPWDYAYEVPTTYCEFHQPQQPQSFERIDNEISSINEQVNNGVLTNATTTTTTPTATTPPATSTSSATTTTTSSTAASPSTTTTSSATTTSSSTTSPGESTTRSTATSTATSNSSNKTETKNEDKSDTNTIADAISKPKNSDSINPETDSVYWWER